MKSYLFALIFFINCGVLFGQELWLEFGDKYFDQFAYEKAIKLYKGALERGAKNPKILEKIGDCYYFISDPESALDYYEDYKTKGNQELSETFLWRYALCLQSAGKPKNQVLDAFKAYYQKVDKPFNINMADSLTNSVEPEKLDINTEYSDFGAFIHKDKLYFSSSRKKSKKRKFNKNLYKWNDQPFLDIYGAMMDSMTNAIRLILPEDSTLTKINTIAAHEGSIAITKNGQTMYYSASNTVNGKLVYNKNGTSNLRLKRASWDPSSNKWVVTAKDSLAMKHFDFDNYSVGNPSLDLTDQRLYFSTCAPYTEAQGRGDIYYVDIINDSTFGPITPIPGINTEGRETFPHISPDGSLFFASNGVHNGRLGFGLLDIYCVRDIDKVLNNKNKTIEHLNWPFNSEKDDFAFFLDVPNGDEQYAYFSSNRDGEEDNDDIYRVNWKAYNPQPKIRTIEILTINSETKELLGNASIDLLDSEGKLEKTLQLSEGSIKLEVEAGKAYNLRGFAKKYFDAIGKIDSASEETKIVLRLKPIPCLVSINYEDFESMNQIEFEFNIDSINEDAKAVLSKILDLLLTNRDMKIKIESHTDSRGSNELNLQLSNRRALNTKAYLMKEGVYESQIESAIGFGEEKPCFTDEEIQNMPIEKRETAHMKNRRSHFIILNCEDNTPICPEIDYRN